MPKWSFLLLTLVLSGCGGFKLWKSEDKVKQREIASLSIQQLMQEETQSFSTEIDEKLLSIHSYNLIAQRNLIQFDESIQDASLEELYQQGPYLKLVAVKTQTDEIEDEIKDLWQYLEKKNDPKKTILEARIKQFIQSSPLASSSMENLATELNLEKLTLVKVTKALINKEYEIQEVRKEFQIYEKNIDHLSHLMGLKIRSKDRKFYPTEGKGGNVTGEEFPAKVWALTFDDGPNQRISPKVLKLLKEKKLKATFFQLAQKVESNPETARAVRDAGMEIASHSYSHKLLTTVGNLTLEKEIKLATENMEKSLNIDVKYFRLPYGIGISTPNIRHQIAEANLIHVVYNIDSLDWLAQSPDMIIKRVKTLMKKTTRDSGILLFHDIHPRTVEAAIAIMDHVAQDGRRVCTVGEIVTDMNEGAETVCLKH